jgi:hypothetical protein
MDNQEFRKLIEKLHAEIQNTQTIDEKGQELLVHLESDIRGLLDRAAVQEASIHPSTIQRLEEGLDHFEVTHPALTLLISKLLESLSKVGI